ncbi:Uncharacterised protein [Chlamydia trachomatis]|nr:Uncharacterised protein [Chlamydia trachomatis]
MQPLRGSVNVLFSATQASSSGSLSLALRGKLGLLHRETLSGFSQSSNNNIPATSRSELGEGCPSYLSDKPLSRAFDSLGGRLFFYRINARVSLRRN